MEEGTHVHSKHVLISTARLVGTEEEEPTNKKTARLCYAYRTSVNQALGGSITNIA